MAPQPFVHLLCFSALLFACSTISARTLTSSAHHKPAVPSGSVSLTHYGEVAAGEVFLATLTRGRLRVQATNFGCIITSVLLPDAEGKQADVVLGFNSFQDYYKSGNMPHFGGIVGRVANRIAEGTFVLDHVRYNLAKNDGNNTLHGGKIGFDKVLWNVETSLDKADGSPYVRFSYYSRDGEEGFPGNLSITITYKLTSDMQLEVDMKGKVFGKKSSPVNLAQHTYWNLGGHNSGTILKNTIQIPSDKITEVDDQLIPTGRILSVEKTPYDFRKAAEIGSKIVKLKHGYDINYVMKGGKKTRSSKGENLKFAARVKDLQSGRGMELHTNQPGLQFYTANFLSGVKGKGGAEYGPHDALCLETQGFPNALNEPKFPSIVVKPGQTYRHIMLYSFFTTE